MKANRVVVVGWDGATFDIIKPMIAAGRLPVLADFLARGVHAPLCSTVPPVTPVAWTSFATGTTPGRHGIFDALTLDPDSHEVRFVSAAMRRVEGEDGVLVLSDLYGATPCNIARRIAGWPPFFRTQRPTFRARPGRPRAIARWNSSH